MYDVAQVRQSDPAADEKENALFEEGYEKYAENRKYRLFRRKIDPNIQVTAAARALAREKGVDLSAVTGTGAGGTITKADVEKAASAATAAKGAAAKGAAAKAKG